MASGTVRSAYSLLLWNNITAKTATSPTLKGYPLLNCDKL